MKVLFATKNPGKYNTALGELSGFDIQLEQCPMEIPEPRADTLREIAREKALYSFRNLNKPLIVLDSGFFLDSWKDFPGTYTNHIIKTLGNRGILRRLGHFRTKLPPIIN